MDSNMHDAFLDLNMDPDSVVMKVIILSILSLSLVIQSTIALTAWYKTKQSPDVAAPVNICFALSFISSFTYTVCFMVYGALDHHEQNEKIDMVTIVQLIGLIFYSLFFWSLLLTFIVRLYITFKSSVYQMSTRLIVLFVFILILMLFLYIIGCVLLFTGFIDIGYYLWFFGFVFYLLGCVLAVYFFISNLSKLTKVLVTPPHHTHTVNTGFVHNAEDTKLCHQQRQISELSSKYMMLFALSILSSVLCVVLMFLVHYDFRNSFVALDLCVNLWCIYLQFAFAEDHYQRCCGWCDQRCRHRGLKRTQQIVYKHSISIKVCSENESRDIGGNDHDSNPSTSTATSGDEDGR